MFIHFFPLQFVGGYPFYKAALQGLRHCSVGMDLLVVLATSIAYVYSVAVLISDSVVSGLNYETFFDSVALLITFISFGRLLEHIAKVCFICNETICLVNMLHYALCLPRRRYDTMTSPLCLLPNQANAMQFGYYG